MAKQDEAVVGLRCRKCGCAWLRVYYTRRALGKIMRCRICEHCNTKMYTTETSIGSKK